MLISALLALSCVENTPASRGKSLAKTKLPCLQKLRIHRELSSVICDALDEWDGSGGGREAQEGGNRCIHIADSGASPIAQQ